MIQRYDLYRDEIKPCDDGDYVLHADHLVAMAAKDAEIAQLNARLYASYQVALEHRARAAWAAADVEAMVREAFRAGVNVASSPRFDGHTPRESVDAIVARVTQGRVS